MFDPSITSHNWSRSSSLTQRSHIFGPSPFFGTPLELVRLQKHLSRLSMQLGWRHLWRTPPQSHRPGPTKLESRRHHPSTHRKPFISGFFNISGKSFYGTLPNELWQLQRLRIVDLSSDIIPVSLPDDTCNCFTEPESFHISSTRFLASFPQVRVIASCWGDCHFLLTKSEDGFHKKLET